MSKMLLRYKKDIPKFEAIYKRRRQKSLFENITLIAVLCMFSIFLHFGTVHIIKSVSIYQGKPAQKTKAIEKPLDFIVKKTIPDPKPKPSPAQKHKKSSITKHKKELTLKKKKPSKMTTAQVKTEGKRFINKVRKGEFPSLVLSYSNPRQYIKQLYKLGAITLLYDSRNKAYFSVDLFKDRIEPITNKTQLKGYSDIRRVVEDAIWNLKKESFAKRLNTSSEFLRIIVLLTLDLEYKWTGKQVNAFKNKGYNVSDVQTVEADFLSGNLEIKRFHLKNGRTQKIE